MSNVLRRLFHRSAQREQVERKHGNRGEVASMPWLPTTWPGPVQPANDPGPVPAVEPTGDAVAAVKQTGDTEPVAADQPAGAPEPVTPDKAPGDPASATAVKPVNDEETIERQIAALISAWNKTSLCARREFLTRIDQRIMTTHRIRSVSRQAAASDSPPFDMAAPALEAPKAADGISAG
jgi:hypothetical protein